MNTTMNTTNSRKRVAYISLIIAEYKKHLYCALDKDSDIELMAFHGQGPKNYPPYDIGKCGEFSDAYVQNIYLRNSTKIVLAFQLLFVKLFKFNPDVIILQDGVKIISNYLILLYAKLFGKKIIWYTHGENRQDRKRCFSRKLKELIRVKYLNQANAIIAYSNGVKDIIVEKGIGRNKVFVSLNTLNISGIEHSKKKLDSVAVNAVRRMHNLEGKKVLCYIGRLVKEKDPLYFLELIKELNKKEQ